MILARQAAGRLKVELHAHTSDDPLDIVPHSAHELIDRAAALGYDALAITLHDKQWDLAPLETYAAARGLVLIPGIERTIEKRHVLLLNFSPASEAVMSFEDLARLRQREPGLVVAPHPFYPLPSCMGRLMDRNAPLIDAVEINAMHTPGVNRFNRAAARWAERFGKPLVGNGDVHRLAQLGSTYSLVEAARDPASICEAIRAGRVEVVSTPMPWSRAGTILADILTAPRRAAGRLPTKSSSRQALTERMPFGTMKRG